MIKGILLNRLPNNRQNPTPCKDAIIVIVLLLAALVFAFPVD